MPRLTALLLPGNDPTRFVTSWCLPPIALLCIRALIATYAFITIFVIWGLEPWYIGQSISYFTHLTFWGLAFYFAFASYHTLIYVLKGRGVWGSGAVYGREGYAGYTGWRMVLVVMHAVYYSSIVTLPGLVTAVFWGVLFDGTFARDFDAWSNISLHGFNAAFALFEILVPRTASPPIFHVVPMILILAGYLGVAYITQATEGFYTYSFLDARTRGSGIVAAYCGGILAGTCILFFVVKGIIAGRRWLVEEKLGMKGWTRDGRGRGNEEKVQNQSP